MTGLYVIAHKRAGAWGSPCKIGITKSKASRVESLQSGNPAAIGIYGFLDISDFKIARQTEKYLHFRFRRQRIRGEWFDVKPEEAFQTAELSFGLLCMALGGVTTDEAIDIGRSVATRGEEVSA